MPEPQSVDLVVEGGSIITMDPTRRIIRDGAIAIKGDRIAAVGKREELRSQYRGARVLDASHHVISPGFVNAHVHFYHQMHRGLSPDRLDGNEWSNYVHEYFAPVITAENEVWAAYITLLELMRSGTTTFLGMGSYNPLPVMEAIQRVGLRGFEGKRNYDYVDFEHSWLAADTDTCMRENEEVMERFAANLDGGLIRPCVDVVGLGRYTDELIVRAKELADRYGAILNLHQCVFPGEVESIKRRTGYTPIVRLHKLGILGPNVVLAHMVNVSDEEIGILAETRANVVHNPGTALKLSYGITQAGKFPEMLEAGVNVAIGTDAGDCINYMDIVRAMYLAAVLYKDIRADARVMGAEVALEMGTVNGARAVGLQEEIGSIEVGKKADIVLFDADNPEWQPLHNEPYNLIYGASGAHVDTVIVDGKIVMEGRQVRTIDEREVLARVKELSRSVLERSGRQPPTTWPIV